MITLSRSHIQIVTNIAQHVGLLSLQRLVSILLVSQINVYVLFRVGGFENHYVGSNEPSMFLQGSENLFCIKIYKIESRCEIKFK